MLLQMATFILSYVLLIIHCIYQYIAYFLIHSSVDGHLPSLHVASTEALGIHLQPGTWENMENSVEVLLGFHNRCKCRFYPLPVGQNTTLVHLGFSQVWRLVSPRSRHWQIGCVVIAHFLVHSRLILLCPHIREGWKSFAAFFLIRALSSSIRTLLSWPNCLAVHTVHWTQDGQGAS